MLTDFIKKHKLPDDFKHLVDEFYQPLAQYIFTKYRRNKTPFFVGINGCQGSGKSTLSAYISQYLSSSHSLNVVVMSLDDFIFLKMIEINLLQAFILYLKSAEFPLHMTHNY